MSLLKDNLVSGNGYALIRYQSPKGEVPFSEWLSSVTDHTIKARILVHLDKIRCGNLGDWKSLGSGLCEIRLHWGSGFRLYFCFVGKRRIVLLSGGTKGTQTRDVQKARLYWLDYRRRFV